MKQLSEENQEWLDKNDQIPSPFVSNVTAYIRTDKVEIKLLEMQQRIQELELMLRACELHARKMGQELMRDDIRELLNKGSK